MWYVLQTITGKEEELVRMIQKIVPHGLYEDCFVAYYERIWRRQQQSIVHVERLFPGYVFVLSEEPEALFFHLKQVPAMSKIIADGDFTFLTLEKTEVDFLKGMLSAKHIMHLSYVETDGKGKVLQVSGPLKGYMKWVIKFHFKKRFVTIKFKLLGAEKTAVLGIVLEEDIRQEIAFGKVETPIEMPPFYEIPLKRENEDSAYEVGDQVQVISGSFENLSGVIWKIKQHTVEVRVHLLGQDMSMEVPLNCIVKLPIRNIMGIDKTLGVTAS